VICPPPRPLSALERDKADGDLALPNGDVLRVTNLRKVFWPALGLTKGDLLRYYVEVSPYCCRRSTTGRW
jgi:bifunctional non-homologous end joining protein LigD